MKKLGFGATLGIAVGTTVGGGIFAFTVPAAKEAGGALPWAFVVGVVPALFALAPIAMLAAALPTAGGNYKYPSRILSPKIAFLAIWIFAFGAFFGVFPLYALTAVDYLQVYLPQLPARPAAAALLFLCFAVNYRGVRLAATFEAALVVLLVIAMLCYAGLGVAKVDPAHLALPPPDGAAGVIAGGSLLTFAYVGSNALIELGHEIDHPARNIPLAMLAALLIVLLLYVGVGVVTVGVVPHSDLAGNADLVGVAGRFMGPGLLAFFVLGGALTAIATSLNAFFLWGTKSLQVLCGDRMLPPAWGVEHPEHGTPHRILTGVFLLSTAGVFLPIPREVFNAYATLGGLVILIPIQIAAVLLPRRFPKAYATSAFKLPGPLRFVAPGVGILLALGAIVTVVLELTYPAALFVFAVWIGAGILYAGTRRPVISGEEGWA